jgi:membrane protein
MPPQGSASIFRLRAIWRLIVNAAADWSHDRAPQLGAALAYYTVFSIAPFLIVLIGIIGLVFGKDFAQETILAQLAVLLGDHAASSIKDMIQRVEQHSTGMLSTTIAIATLLVGISAFFGQLQEALNTVWGVVPKEGRGMWGFIRDRFLSLVAVLGIGFLLLVSLMLSIALSALGKWVGTLLPFPEVIMQILNMLLSFTVITGLFALMFKLLPDAHIAWRDVWVGAAVTSGLFTFGQVALGVYLGKSNVETVYGAAGSLVVVLIWVYYSAQILLYGAELTKVYANRLGERISPTSQAEPASSTDALRSHHQDRAA